LIALSLPHRAGSPDRDDRDAAPRATL